MRKNKKLNDRIATCCFPFKYSQVFNSFLKKKPSASSYKSVFQDDSPNVSEHDDWDKYFGYQSPKFKCYQVNNHISTSIKADSTTIVPDLCLSNNNCEPISINLQMVHDPCADKNFKQSTNVVKQTESMGSAKSEKEDVTKIVPLERIDTNESSYSYQCTLQHFDKPVIRENSIPYSDHTESAYSCRSSYNSSCAKSSHSDKNMFESMNASYENSKSGFSLLDSFPLSLSSNVLESHEVGTSDSDSYLTNRRIVNAPSRLGSGCSNLNTHSNITTIKRNSENLAFATLEKDSKFKHDLPCDDTMVDQPFDVALTIATNAPFESVSQLYDSPKSEKYIKEPDKMETKQLDERDDLSNFEQGLQTAGRLVSIVLDSIASHNVGKLIQDPLSKSWEQQFTSDLPRSITENIQAPLRTFTSPPSQIPLSFSWDGTYLGDLCNTSNSLLSDIQSKKYLKHTTVPPKANSYYPTNSFHKSAPNNPFLPVTNFEDRIDFKSLPYPDEENKLSKKSPYAVQSSQMFYRQPVLLSLYTQNYSPSISKPSYQVSLNATSAMSQNDYSTSESNYYSTLPPQPHLVSTTNKFSSAMVTPPNHYSAIPKSQRFQIVHPANTQNYGSQFPIVFNSNDSTIRTRSMLNITQNFEQFKPPHSYIQNPILSNVTDEQFPWDEAEALISKFRVTKLHGHTWYILNGEDTPRNIGPHLSNWHQLLQENHRSGETRRQLLLNLAYYGSVIHENTKRKVLQKEISTSRSADFIAQNTEPATHLRINQTDVGLMTTLNQLRGPISISPSNFDAFQPN